MRKYYCLALAQDCAGFSSDKDVAIALKHMFTTALELPTEEAIEEQIHVPTEEVNIKNTLVYTQLTSFKEDEWVCKVAKTVEEAKQLIELDSSTLTR